MRFCRALAGVTVAAIMSWAAFATAQVVGADDESESVQPGATAAADDGAAKGIPEGSEQNEVIDEIKVVVSPQGKTAYELEMERQARMKEAVFAEMRLRERDEEELTWRQADPDLKDPESRIKWGYSPQAEYRMRRENDFMYDLSTDQTKPASLFRVEL